MKIENTNLSVRVKNALKNKDIILVQDLLELNNDQLYNVENLGEASINEIKQFKVGLNHAINNLQLNNDNSINLYELIEESPHQKIKDVLKRIFSHVEKICFIEDGSLTNYKYLKNISKRAKNIIEENSLNEIDNLMEFSLFDIQRLPNSGKKSFDEIFEFLIEDIVVVVENNELYGSFENIIGYLMVQKFEGNFERNFLNEIYTKACQVCLQKEFKKEYNWRDIHSDFSRILTENNVINEIFKDSYLKEGIVVNIIKESKWPVNVASIKNKLPQNLNTINVAEIINELRKQDKILLVEHGFKYKNQGIVEYLKRNFPEEKKVPMLLRLHGNTLEEIGSAMGYTRERARQIISKIIPKIPLNIFEERYSDYFTNYHLNKEQFMKIFLTEEIEYHYLQIKYEKGDIPFENIIDDESVDEEVKVRLREILNEGYIVIENDRIKETKSDIIKYLVREYCSESISVHEFSKIYYEFLQEHNLNIEKQTVDKRYIEGRIADSDFAISLTGRTFRYYKFDDYDWTSFYEELPIENYNNKEISTFKLFNDKPYLMEMYDINNEYELHNILKKTQSYCHLQLNFKRMPTLKIGKADRDEQVLNIFLTHVPIEANKLGKIYEEEYGVKKNTALANHFKCISNHLYNGIYIYESEDIKEENLTILQNILNGNQFHFIEDIKMKLKNQGVSNMAINKMMTPIIIENMGYNTYSTYILSKIYQKVSDYIKKKIFNEDIVNISNIDPRFINLSTVQSVIRDFNNNLDYLEFDDNHYISIDKLSSLDLSKDYLKNIVDEIYNSMSEEIFSIKMVKDFVEGAKIEEFGFSDKFYVSLLRSHNKIYTLKVGRSYLFSKNNSDLRMVRLIQDVMNVRKAVDIYELIDYLDETYGLHFEKSSIIETTKDSGMYYDSIMEKLYLDNEYYYEEFDL